MIKSVKSELVLAFPPSMNKISIFLDIAIEIDRQLCEAKLEMN